MRFLLIFYFTFYSFVVYSQNNKQSAFTFTYNHQFPKGELAKYFGSNSAVGCSFFQEKENNFFYGIQGSYMFSNNIKKTNLFNNITTSTGAIIAGDGTYANIILQQRGFDENKIRKETNINKNNDKKIKYSVDEANLTKTANTLGIPVEELKKMLNIKS